MAFVSSADRRFQSSALAALLAIYGLVDPQEPSVGGHLDRIDIGERLFEIYDYVRECFPELEIDFEGLVLLRTSLRRREVIQIATCERCQALIVAERFDRKHRTCMLCCEGAEARTAGHTLSKSAS